MKQHIDREDSLSILDREGAAAIWMLCVAAAEAHRTGHPGAAAAIQEIAETAEAAWLATAEGLKGRWADAARPEPSHEDQAPL
jgi:hypothetical protein